jgi:hypothetical protein
MVVAAISEHALWPPTRSAGATAHPRQGVSARVAREGWPPRALASPSTPLLCDARVRARYRGVFTPD